MSATSLSPFDVTIVFQRLAEIAPAQPGIIDQVAISFSPQQLKALVRSLTETINGYEEAFGKLTIPDTDIAPQKKASEIAAVIDSVRGQRANPSSTEQPPPSEQSRDVPRKKEKRP